MVAPLTLVTSLEAASNTMVMGTLSSVFERMLSRELDSLYAIQETKFEIELHPWILIHMFRYLNPEFSSPSKHLRSNRIFIVNVLDAKVLSC